MRYWYNGEIKFDNPLSDEALDKILTLLTGGVEIQDEGKTISFLDFVDSDLSDCLEAIKEIARNDGKTIIDESTLVYTGEYDGAFVYHSDHDKWEDMSETKYVLHIASDNAISEEVERRGMEIRFAEILRQYVENDLETAEPDYVREVLFDIIGMTKEEAETCGLGDLFYNDEDAE